jgi:5-methylcytosine-specific restriction endonuclease McrA
MTQKKKHRGPSKGRRPRGNNRARAVLSVVKTDNTFKINHTGDGCLNQSIFWLGKCIHCNCKLYVTEQGNTEATLEHIDPLCNGGESTDPRNLALACEKCNNEKGVRHDRHVGKGGRADEVVAALRARRSMRWREPIA